MMWSFILGFVFGAATAAILVVMAGILTASAAEEWHRHERGRH